MARAFAKISSTPNVQAVQTKMGSRTAYQSAELGDMSRLATAVCRAQNPSRLEVQVLLGNATADTVSYDNSPTIQ